MARFYKIFILFLIIFLAGVASFAGYISYTLDEIESSKAKAIELENTTSVVPQIEVRHKAS
ncbi:hypothetical protein ACG2LH_03015 [Zhouia sp. PK063]|uniref:hypothetical protein n=1 Tax=Zhouia sp. PK063 TaxID=3373602 RepID=UPI00378DE6C3